jgi:hypothetical protein
MIFIELKRLLARVGRRDADIRPIRIDRRHMLQ